MHNAKQRNDLNFQSSKVYSVYSFGMFSRNTSLRPETTCILLDQTIDAILVTPISFYVILRPHLVLLEPKDVEKSGKITRLDKIYKDSSAMTKNRELPERSLSPIIAIV